MWTLHQIAPPNKEPLDLELHAKKHLRVEHSEDDILIETQIQAARAWASGPEGYTKRQFMKATWRLDLDALPCGRDPIVVPLPPLNAVTSIVYVDLDGNEVTLATSAYTVQAPSGPDFPADSPRARIFPAHGTRWPQTRSCTPDAVRVLFDCGYTNDPVQLPGIFTAAMLLVVGELYKNREESISGTITSPTVLRARDLLFNLRDRERSGEAA